MSKQIIANIDKRGNVTMDAQGFVGDECLGATKSFEDALQAVEVRSDPKPEMYDASESTEREKNLNF